MGVKINKTVLRAPIRWAGSKKILLNEMLAVFDNSKDVYVEPFLGSGVVLINTLNNNVFKRYYVNDINENIIAFYQLLKESPDELIKGIRKICAQYNHKESMDEKCDFYKLKRDSYNRNRLKPLSKTITFWFLMAAGFNGVYRVNSERKFNVPCGKREKIICDERYLKKVSQLIQNVVFLCMDYQEFLDYVRKIEQEANCFLYCDPPYIPATDSMENQILYTQQCFAHKCFVEYMVGINAMEESSFMISMAESDKATIIYNNEVWKKMNLSEIVRKVNPKKKIKSKEIAYINYEVKIEGDSD